MWIGVVGTADISIASNICKDKTDCNLNGVCESGICVCNQRDDVSSVYMCPCLVLLEEFDSLLILLQARYFGTHCEVRLPNLCERITYGENSE